VRGDAGEMRSDSKWSSRGRETMGTCKGKGTEIKERDQRNERRRSGSVGRRSVGREVKVSTKGGKVDERKNVNGRAREHTSEKRGCSCPFEKSKGIYT
jgi:hypothetical protein